MIMRRHYGWIPRDTILSLQRIVGSGYLGQLLATVLRTSTDNGATWSTARLIMPAVEDSLNMPVRVG